MPYKVIRHFIDLQDENHSYNVGDKFPHNGISISKRRIAELSSANNKQNTPLIAWSGVAEKPKYTKRDITLMSKEKLVNLGKELKIEGVEDKPANEIKKLIIDVLKL